MNKSISLSMKLQIGALSDLETKILTFRHLVESAEYHHRKEMKSL